MSTRFRLIATAIIIPLAFTLLTALDITNPVFVENKLIIVSAVIAILQMILIAWVVNFRLSGERLFTVLLFPTISQAIIITFLEFVVLTFTDDITRVSSLAFSSSLLFVLTYILNSNMNILNLSVLQNIPLGQAGRAAHYVLTLVFTYFFFVLLIGWDYTFLAKLAVVFAFTFTYTFVALWTIALAYNQRFISSVSIALLMTLAFLVLGMWPLEPFYFSLFLVLMYYMSLGVALEIREIISRWLWYEYTALFIVMAILLLTTASWGVNGTIL